MKRIIKSLAAGITALFIALSLLNLQAFVSYADETEEGTAVVTADETSVLSVEIISINQVDFNGTPGEGAQVSVKVSDENGNVPEAIVGKYVVFLSVGNKYEKVPASGVIDFKQFRVSNGKSYEIYAILKNGDEFVAESGHTTINAIKPDVKASKISSEASYEGEASGKITVDGVSRLAYYLKGVGAVSYVDGNTITGLGEGTYYVYSPAYREGDTFYLESSKPSVIIGKNVRPSFIISTSANDAVSWSKTEVTLKQGLSDSIRVSATDDLHYITNVYAVPADAAQVSFYSNTGEVSVSNLNGNLTLYAEVAEKPVATNVEVLSVSFNENGIYSEENPAVQTQIEVKVTDQFGNPVPKEAVYFKPDESEVSFSQKRETDESGIAVFKYSFGINVENGGVKESYKPLFSLNDSFENAASTEINLVLQKKKDLVLYEDQLVGSKPEEKTGKVTGVPEGYEIWTGEVHQGALVVGSGEWVKAVNGEFTGLSSGQQLLRAGEKIEKDTNTFYFASNYADFFIPRIEYGKNEVKEEVKEETKEEVKEETKEEVKEEVKEETKEEVKEETKEEVKEIKEVPKTSESKAETTGQNAIQQDAGLQNTEQQLAVDVPPIAAIAPAQNAVLQTPALTVNNDDQQADAGDDNDADTTEDSSENKVVQVTENIENEAAALADTVKDDLTTQPELLSEEERSLLIWPFIAGGVAVVLAGSYVAFRISKNSQTKNK